MPYAPQKVISENNKTGCSINFPIKGHCRPTKLCKSCCYAKCGHMALPNSVRKQQFVSKYFLGNDLRQIIGECAQFHTVRLNGSGDLLTGHVNNIIRLADACPTTEFYGMTRKPEIATAINNQLSNLSILLSVDVQSPKSVWKYPGKLCFGPRRFNDEVPNDKRVIMIFPYHFLGKVVKHVPEHPLDCPAVRHTVSGCLECGRCWNWYK